MCVCVRISAGAASQDAQTHDTQTCAHIAHVHACKQSSCIGSNAYAFFVHVLTGASTVTDNHFFFVRPCPAIEKVIYR